MKIENIEPLASTVDQELIKRDDKVNLMNEKKDIIFMQEAITLAKQAEIEGEVPVGALIVKDNKIIGQGYNQKETLNDPTAHAEIIAITAACNTLRDWRLNDCTLYVT